MLRRTYLSMKLRRWWLIIKWKNSIKIVVVFRNTKTIKIIISRRVQVNFSSKTIQLFLRSKITSNNQIWLITSMSLPFHMERWWILNSTNRGMIEVWKIQVLNSSRRIIRYPIMSRPWMVQSRSRTSWHLAQVSTTTLRIDRLLL